jgi:superfamily I DNA/RNA helicase
MLAKDPDADCTAITDKADSLREVIKSSTHKTVEALRGEIQTLFADNGQGVLTLSTIHKSKGLEAERVWVLGATESGRATKAWAVQQERNLTYVAVTRAKLNLFFFDFPPRA